MLEYDKSQDFNLMSTVFNFFLEHSALKGPESSSYLGTFN
jgi:hypothetical protein